MPEKDQKTAVLPQIMLKKGLKYRCGTVLKKLTLGFFATISVFERKNVLLRAHSSGYSRRAFYGEKQTCEENLHCKN